MKYLTSLTILSFLSSMICPHLAHAEPKTLSIDQQCAELKGLQNQAGAPILDKEFEQLLLFVVKPYSKTDAPSKVTPVNQDLLQSFATTYGYKIEKCSKSLNSNLSVRTLFDIQRFNDPLKMKFKQSQTLIPDPSDQALSYPPPPEPFLMWQSKDGKRIARKLKSLSEEKIFWTIPYDLVTEPMLKASTKRAHFRKVDTRSKPEEANPGNKPPDTSSFLPSDRNTTSH